MRSAYSQPSADWRHGSSRRRPKALLLALVVHGLVVIGLVSLAPTLTRKLEPERKAFKLLPIVEPQVAPKQTPKVRVERKKKAAGGAAPRLPVPRTPPPAPVPTLPPEIVIVTKDVFAAADIGKLPAPPAGANGTTAGKDSAAAYGPGEGPGGERLYNAEWYIEPTHAELAYYLQGGRAKPGWGMIACRTVENYHVDGCVQLGESPPGSGLSRVLRQAAWQFRVRPPRIGGKPQIGAWVRIRFDFSEGAAK